MVERASFSEGLHERAGAWEAKLLGGGLEDLFLNHSSLFFFFLGWAGILSILTGFGVGTGNLLEMEQFLSFRHAKLLPKSKKLIHSNNNNNSFDH